MFLFLGCRSAISSDCQSGGNGLFVCWLAAGIVYLNEKSDGDSAAVMIFLCWMRF
jgi:hypothetical protein